MTIALAAGTVPVTADHTSDPTAAPARSRLLRRAAALALVAGIAVAWWATLAPTVVGGPLAAVVVDGTSMQPLFHTGDVVIVHRESSYHLGEIVAVRVDGGEVIHQLVAGNARTGWRTKGINRRTEDGWTIPESHIIGRKWVFLPGAGRWTSTVRTPAGTAALFGVVAFLAVALPTGRRRNRHRQTLGATMRQTTRSLADPSSPAAAWRPAHHRAEPALLGVLGLAGVAALVADVASAFPKRDFSLLPYRLPADARLWAWVATAAVVLAAGVLAGRVLRGWGGPPADRAAALLRERLVPVRAVGSTGTVIEVATARDLARIARIAVAPVLHQVRDGEHLFAVAADGVLYALVVPSGAGAVRHLRSPARHFRRSAPARAVVTPAG